MEFDSPRQSVSERLQRKLGQVSGEGINPETGRSYAEERMIRIMEERGGKGFRVLRSAEVAPKQYQRSTD